MFKKVPELEQQLLDYGKSKNLADEEQEVKQFIS